MPYNSDVGAGGVSVPLVRGSELVLHDLGNKVAQGKELNWPEHFEAVSLSSENMREKFGPTPANMPPLHIELPESTKGVLANYAG